mmetsp:Transcript_8799/g.19347  ORF Transcript_8799/g.19347 Transcript_8799/m.19347 type:complete len:294 (-) Transcript_8799:293-1174(-)
MSLGSCGLARALHSFAEHLEVHHASTFTQALAPPRPAVAWKVRQRQLAAPQGVVVNNAIVLDLNLQKITLWSREQGELRTFPDRVEAVADVRRLILLGSQSGHQVWVHHLVEEACVLRLQVVGLEGFQVHSVTPGRLLQATMRVDFAPAEEACGEACSATLADHEEQAPKETPDLAHQAQPHNKSRIEETGAKMSPAVPCCHGGEADGHTEVLIWGSCPSGHSDAEKNLAQHGRVEDLDETSLPPGKALGRLRIWSLPDDEARGDGTEKPGSNLNAPVHDGLREADPCLEGVR